MKTNNINGYYKSKYTLCFYDLDDNYVYSFKNIRTYLDFLGIEQTKENVVTMSGKIAAVLKGRNKYIRINNHKLKVYAYDFSEELENE